MHGSAVDLLFWLPEEDDDEEVVVDFLDDVDEDPLEEEVSDVVTMLLSMGSREGTSFSAFFTSAFLDTG
jgi:hypothetical protein